jgi:hypothetical protein
VLLLLLELEPPLPLLPLDDEPQLFPVLYVFWSRSSRCCECELGRRREYGMVDDDDDEAEEEEEADDEEDGVAVAADAVGVEPSEYERGIM